jgi:hypothetical protein
MEEMDKLAKSQTEEATVRTAAAYLQSLPDDYMMCGPPEESEQRVWNHLTYYLNADLPADTSAYLRLLQALYELTRSSRPFMVFRLKECGWGDDDDFAIIDLLRDNASDFVSLAGQYQTDLKNLMLWLCKPKSHAELRKHALSFLEESAQGESWKVDYALDALADQADDVDEDDARTVYIPKYTEYASIVVPICKFILEYIDFDHGKGLPIRVCKRPECGKFFVPQRTGRKFYCSDDCRAVDHQKDKSKLEQADYMYVHRLEKLTDKKLLEIKLRQSEVRNRLEKIEQRWSWAKEKVGGLRVESKNHAKRASLSKKSFVDAAVRPGTK